ncbi:hypothetical protein [Neobacillus muris]|uniref:hypothetical protein n=1 Tax=Neobacillus muris TaxID=2941334 RepID=UPI0020416E1F|nr:hypothetical protein [Neobacillus muris]
MHNQDEEKKTMNERIKAFYAQSGGPNNPQINQIIEKHLLYGKDHGAQGKRETFKDAIMDVFLDDFSTKDMVMWLLKTKYDMKDRWEELISVRSVNGQIAAGHDNSGEIQRLEKLEYRMAAIEEKLQTILEHVQQNPMNSSS